MKVVSWKLPVAAPWTRALDLKELSFAEAKLVLLVQEEESGALWRLTFKTVQAFKAITQECAGKIFSQLPQNGGLFEVLASPWIKDLGEAHFLAKSHHYVVCCYDDVFEVVAWDADATLVDESSNVTTDQR
jgi:hypothetical protein